MEDTEEAQIILDNLSNEDILCGENSNSDFKKKLQTLKFRYHPDRPRDGFTYEIQNIIMVKINSLLDKKQKKREATKSYNSNKKPATYSKEQAIQLLIQEIYKEYEKSSNKEIYIPGVMKKLLNIENKYSVDLGKTKEKVIQLLIQEIYKEYEKSSDKEIYQPGVMKKLLNIENEYSVDLGKTKEKVIQLLIQEIYKEYEKSSDKEIYQPGVMKKLLNIEEDYSVDLVEWKNKVEALAKL
jgi:hypothetical protein